jgi:CubicO group peptidase (beta-lactamase class C family)
MREPFERVAALLRDAIARRAFPGAAMEVGRAAAPVWQGTAGTLTYDPDAPAVDRGTVYDLASLTKVLATTPLAMRAVDAGRLRLDARIAGHFPEWRGADREAVTVRDLLSHCSGLTGYLPLFRDYTGRAEFQHAICALPLEYAPGSRAIYSDLAFMLLGFLLDDVLAPGEPRREPSAGSPPSTTLEAHFTQLASALGAEPISFNPPREWRPRTAPTEIDSWRGRLLAAEVHDENTWALGGVAGHAGLFGTAAAVGAFARATLETIAGRPVIANPATMREFIARRPVPGSSRALGWDTMLPTSSCGARLSPTSIGHTGFTGTSLWIDWERDFYVVLLTNRVHPTRENHLIRQARPALHDAVADIVNG